jgi:signal transduction histidine kinase
VLFRSLDNATKAAGKNGTVHVEVKSLDRFAFIDVADSGPGMQNDKVRPGAHGLALVHRLLEMNSGTLEIGVSEKLGGALFRVRLPRRTVP